MPRGNNRLYVRWTGSVLEPFLGMEHPKRSERYLESGAGSKTIPNSGVANALAPHASGV